MKPEDLMKMARSLNGVEFSIFYDMVERYAEKYYPADVRAIEKRRKEIYDKNIKAITKIKREMKRFCWW